MKRAMLHRMLVLGAAGLAVAGIAASGASATSAQNFSTTSNFLCYSTYQVDPGAWPTAVTSPERVTAADLLAQGGYWSPYAESTVPTSTQITGGDYLICNLPASLQPVQGMIVTQKGVVLPTSPLYAGESGLYPEATAVASSS